MAERTRTTTMPKVGEQLPALTFDAIDGGAGAGLRSGRGPRTVFTPHGYECAACAAYLDTLAGAAPAIRHDWGGRLFVVLPDAALRSFYSPREGVRLLLDANGAFATGDVALYVADEWGELYHTTDGSSTHDLPGADELVEWARFVAIQCPECEGPEGPWRTL